MRCIIFLSAVLLLSFSSMAQKGFSFANQPAKKQLDVLYNNKLLTSYCFYDSSRKPFLFPVNTTSGVTVTRGYPFAPRAGERTDHPHHTGIWLNYESVNGLDFWNNSTAITPEKRNQYGTIIHEKVVGNSAKGNTASLTTTARWVRPDQKKLLDERSTYLFTVSGNDFIIDRITQLTAADTTVIFKDVKDGMFAIRVARELEQPAKDVTSFVDDKGNVTKVAPSGADVTGLYTNSDGVTGDSVWSTKGKWCVLNGTKDGQAISIGMFDHPANVGYPGYWHARGYGLFAINPLGRKVFSKGAEELNYTLAPGQSIVFRYRIVVHAGDHLDAARMEAFSKEFEGIK